MDKGKKTGFHDICLLKKTKCSKLIFRHFKAIGCQVLMKAIG
jgi:hypothetical protein